MPKESRPGEKGFLTELVELKDAGDTVLEGNEPEDIFYVSTLISKQEPSIAAFYDAYRNAKSEAGRDVLEPAAIVESSGSTVVVHPGNGVLVDAYGNLVIEVGD